MNSIIVLISIFSTLSFRFTDGGIGFSSTINHRSEEILYPALEVILQGNKIIIPQNAEDSSETIKLSGSQKFLYLCFGEEEIQFSFQYNYINRKCLFPKRITSQREIVTCREEVIPTRMRTPIKCGSDDRDVLELIYHEICFKEYFIDMGFRNEDLAEVIEDEATILNEIIIVYSFCSRLVVTDVPDELATKQEQTVFVRYEISSYESTRQPRPEKFKTNFYQNSCRISSCNYMPQCYKQKNQTKAFELMFPGVEMGEDYLAEQMLVSVDDIVTDIAVDSLANYVNVKPQWKSLQKDWDNLGAYIREKSKMVSMRSFSDSQNDSNKEFAIYSGTFGEFEDLQNRKIQIGTSPLKFTELAKSSVPETRLIIDVSRLHYTKTCTIPIYWWKLVTSMNSNTAAGIIIGLLNHPKHIPVSQKYNIEPLCVDVCHLYGWQEVKNINNDIFCCEPQTELLQKLLLHFSTYVAFGGTLNLNEEFEENFRSSLASSNLFFIAGDRYFSDNLRTNPQYYQVLY